MTKKDGATVGVIFALAILSGMIRVQGVSQKTAIWLILAAGVIVEIHDLFKHRSLVSPSVDGFVIRFGLAFGVLNLVFGNIP